MKQLVLYSVDTRTGEMEPVQKARAIYPASARQVSDRTWDFLFRLVKVKKGETEAENIEEYLKDTLNVPRLQYATRNEIDKLIEFLSGLPDKAA